MENGPENGILSEYLTKAELANQLNRSIRSVDRWALTGYGPPCVRIGRRSLYRRAAVVEWLRRLEIKPGRGGMKHVGVQAHAVLHGHAHVQQLLKRGGRAVEQTRAQGQQYVDSHDGSAAKSRLRCT